MYKLVSIVGPTAVGKTDLALAIISGSEASFDIISADSRQIYSDLAIISGADVPNDYVFCDNGNEIEDKYWESKSKKTRIYGVGVRKSDEDWSVAHFKNFAQKVIQRSWQDGRQPIIVGGTGLYHEHLFNDSPILDIKPNKNLRRELKEKTVAELQQILAQRDAKKMANLNQSDKLNPARLIRAIEIALALPELDELAKKSHAVGGDTLPTYQHLIIGLKDEPDTIKTKIAKRVVARFNLGAKSEVERIGFKVEEGVVSKQLLSAIGVREIQAFLDGQIDEEACLEKWSVREWQYAKRQLTWWRKKPGIVWFEISQENWQKQALEQVRQFLVLA